ncbi:hypothetical protein BOTBODRAFT_56861 [Botryobasidium botryosum FD-172 SS1]|uniref:Cyanovirin-N domain-containing protein n=1 Tax=Botryobasidium botryosum (strain FD-172 SS1) TaxID=930990 RepID=A0A067ML58_BOTB1|nr:hypothetical protein BOTBODRAFT_56861 [Botryobasidium botryosum FD-172 SS1]
MLLSLSKKFLAAVCLAASFHCASAVCKTGEIAVGRAEVGAGRQGFLMTNNCEIFAKNQAVPYEDSPCRGGYNGGAKVECNSKHQPISAVDTRGFHYNCKKTTDDSCNKTTPAGHFHVLACCTPAH